MAERRATATIDIAAPIARVWEVMTDFARYGEWNPFIYRVDGPSGAPAVGKRFHLHVRWSGGGEVASLEEFARIEPPAGSPAKATLVYDFRGPLHVLGLVRASRIQTLETLPDGRTRYFTEERFKGLLAFGIPLPKVQAGFDAHAGALQRRAEGAAA